MAENNSVESYLTEAREYGSDFALETSLLSDIESGTISGSSKAWSELEQFFTGKTSGDPQAAIRDYLKRSFDELVKIGG